MNFHSKSLLRSAPACAVLAFTWLMPSMGSAQDPATQAVAAPVPVPTVPAIGTAASPATPIAPVTQAADGNDKILLNFQGATLSDVLNYLSEAAGFVVVQEVPVSGTVNIVSRQPITGEEAVDLLNAVLIEKGFTAIRNGRILKIVSRTDAPRRDIPVQMGSNPELIPRKDDMVTQILPLRYGEAAKLIENLRPLLPPEATITANESSNAILMTDTQTNIRRIAQIIRALDSSVNSSSAINIFPLQFADAKEVATVITQLFSGQQAVSTQGGQGGGQGGRGGFGGGGFGGFGGRGGFGGGGGRGPGGGGGAPSGGGQSEARLAASRVVAVADEQSNSVIVSASDENITTIREIIVQIDTSISDVTQTRIFRLTHADAMELAEIVNSVFSDLGGNNQNGQRGGRGQGQWPGQGQWGQGQGQGRGGNPQSQQSGRALLQSRVVAVGDPRTNSMIVNAARDTLVEISEMVDRLDATDAKKQRVYVHKLEHADADTVANVLRGMLGDTTVSGGLQNGTSRLTERTATGASIDSNQSSGGGIGGGGRAR